MGGFRCHTRLSTHMYNRCQALARGQYRLLHAFPCHRAVDCCPTFPASSERGTGDGAAAIHREASSALSYNESWHSSSIADTGCQSHCVGNMPQLSMMLRAICMGDLPFALAPSFGFVSPAFSSPLGPRQSFSTPSRLTLITGRTVAFSEPSRKLTIKPFRFVFSLYPCSAVGDEESVHSSCRAGCDIGVVLLYCTVLPATEAYTSAAQRSCAQW